MELHDSFKLKIISSYEQWTYYWQKVSKANLLQSWEYGLAKEQAEGWRAVRFLTMDEKDNPVGLAQILTYSLPFLGGIARLNRGPVLIGEFSEDVIIDRSLKVIQTILQEARKRRWWIVQIAPELPNTETVHNALKSMGFRFCSKPAWASGRLSLKKDDQEILMGFDGKWRNCLRKGLKMDMFVTNHNGACPELDLLIQSYTDFQKEKKFESLTEKMIRNLGRQHNPDWQFNLFVAKETNSRDTNETIGMVVTVRHGDTTTYLIGITNEKGRKMQANSVLLWNAILHAKREGCNWFDIGGLSDTTPKGIAEFKKGLKADPYVLVGEWRWYYLPWQKNNCKSARSFH